MECDEAGDQRALPLNDDPYRNYPENISRQIQFARILTQPDRVTKLNPHEDLSNRLKIRTRVRLIPHYATTRVSYMVNRALNKRPHRHRLCSTKILFYSILFYTLLFKIDLQVRTVISSSSSGQKVDPRRKVPIPRPSIHVFMTK